MKLNIIQLEKLDKLMLGEISLQEFTDTINLSNKLEVIIDMISYAKLKNDPVLLSNITWGLGILLTSNEKLSLYRLLLLDEWHREHEEIVTAFQIDYNEEIDNLNYLEYIIQSPPKYISERFEFKDSFIKKCSFAIANYPSEYAIQLLKKLSNSNDLMILKYIDLRLSDMS